MAPEPPPGKRAPLRSRAGASCQRCGAEVPSRHVIYEQNIGMVFTRVRRTVEGFLCPPCVRGAFWKMTLPMLFFGWFGMISLFVTPIFLIQNVVQYAKASGRTLLVLGTAGLFVVGVVAGGYFFITHLPQMMPGYYDPNAHKLPASAKVPPSPPVPPKSPAEVRVERLAAAEETVGRLEQGGDRDIVALARQLLEFVKREPTPRLTVDFTRRSELAAGGGGDRKIVPVGFAFSEKEMQPVEASVVRLLDALLGRALGWELLACEAGPPRPGSPSIIIDYVVAPAGEIADHPIFESRAGAMFSKERLQPFRVSFSLRLVIPQGPKVEVTGTGQPGVTPRRSRPPGGIKPIGYEYTDRAAEAFDDFLRSLELRLHRR